MRNRDTQSQRPVNTLYAEVTDRIVAELEAGRLPWVQPWGQNTAEVGMPCNAGTGRRYSGINVLILWATLFERGYSSQRWLTYKQAQALGGNVRKGETGTTVCYADRFTPRGEDGEQQSLGDCEEPRKIAFLKRFTVFNVDQCEGLGSGLAAAPVPLAEDQIVEVADDVIAASAVDFRTGGMEAFYVPSQDLVMVPARRAFHDPINAYRTWLHELVHATGHASRLGRDLTNPFGSAGYAREELIAEMGSAFLCAALGIVPTVRHADYIGSWLEVLREDNRAIFRAASAAGKAADWLLERHAQACRAFAQEEAA
ncbi:zincin-like metallopeptidase domain-containing protein [Sphingomonas oligophenolica]|uniref:Zincin-like metallopeptidase domain-containing protein n=1 Tax=Sphingomonas oligophenolica TaxID=301154 RepID=A0ABU9Y6P7_9SPHN